MCVEAVGKEFGAWSALNGWIARLALRLGKRLSSRHLSKQGKKWSNIFGQTCYGL